MRKVKKTTHRVYNAVMWKDAVDILNASPNITSVQLSRMLLCEIATARYIKKNYKEIFKSKVSSNV